MMLEVMTQIFGVYQPIVQTLSDGTVQFVTNWGYICGVAIFGVCLWSAFRTLGMVFKR